MTDEHMKKYCETHEGFDKEKYKQLILSEECPEDAPKRKAGLLKKRPCDPDEIDNEIAKL